MNPLDIIANAASHLHTVSLTYTDAKGQTSMREVEPYSLRPGKEGSTRFFGFDVTKQAIRGFRMDRINGVQLTGNSFVPKWVVEFAG